MRAYYNENDPYAAEWLRNLIAAGRIAEGVVDDRSIAEVTGAELAAFDQCHFFAGIGGWPLALRLAGWPDDRPVWTGSCPCQPFSAAGKGLGESDPRHLWPEFHRLISECRPPTVFGEQVTSAAGRGWLAGVRADLEALGYAVGAADLCAAGVGAPHIRQRLWWVADANGDGSLDGINASEGRRPEAIAECGGPSRLADADQGQRRWLADGEGCQHDGQTTGWQQSDRIAQPGSTGCRLADADTPGEREQRRGGLLDGERPACGHDADGRGEVCGLGDTDDVGPQGRADESVASQGRQSEARPSGLSGAWGNTIWLPCADGKARRIESGLEPLAHGVPNRVGRLRAYGNAIVPAVAAEFIKAFQEAQP